ncbi:hypothetical protein HZA57_05525 [Candidatus Poribacteria bacterium]|nr:hypothetical protein [Candidatus Poribacteria bacterium]
MTSEEVQVIAVDWSGAAKRCEKHIWAAVWRDGSVRALECGRNREAVIRWIIEQAREHPATVVGLDFAFSFPKPFVEANQCRNGPALWRLVREKGETWLGTCEPPFWGRTGKKKPVAHERDGFRQTDREAVTSGHTPKSVFQIGGAGAVGTGSIRGMPHLLTLQNAGFHVWPFDNPGWPLCVEIYPRALTGEVVKSSKRAREDYLQRRVPPSPRKWIEIVQSQGEKESDAFDALVSAMVMSAHAGEFQTLQEQQDPYRVEGRIWCPGKKEEGSARN